MNRNDRKFSHLPLFATLPSWITHKVPWDIWRGLLPSRELALLILMVIIPFVLGLPALSLVQGQPDRVQQTTFNQKLRQSWNLPERTFDFGGRSFPKIHATADVVNIIGPGRVTAPLIEMLRRRSPNLKRMQLEAVYIESRALSGLRKFEQLATLTVLTSNLNDEHVQDIAECSELESLFLYCTTITDLAIPVLHAMTQLSWLRVSNCPLFPRDTNEAFQNAGTQFESDSNGIQNRPEAEVGEQVLVIGSVEFRARGDLLHVLPSSDFETGRLSPKLATLISRFRGIKSMILDRVVITEDTFERLSTLPELQSLTLKKLDIPDASLDILATCPTLEHLRMEAIPVTIDVLPAISMIPKLRRLEIFMCRELDNSRRAIKFLCPQLEVFLLETAGSRGGCNNP